MTAPEVRRVTTASGAVLAVHDLGGGGRALLLAHAAGFCALTLGPLAAALGGAFDTWAVDLRGHGRSDPAPGGEYSWSAQARDLLEVVGTLELSGPIGFGHSAGATILLDAEARRPGTFSALVCFEPPLWPGAAPPGLTEALAEGASKRRRSFADAREAFDHFSVRRPLSALAPAALHAYVAHGFGPGPEGAVTLVCSPEVEAATYRAGGVHDGFSRLERVHCPVVILTGGASPPMVAEMAADQAAALAEARVTVIEGVGHFGPLEAPGRLADALVAAQ